VFCAVCPNGAHPGGGVDSDRNVLPVDPPVISTLPSSEVPDPVIRVAVAPLRAVVIWPPLLAPATVKLPVVLVVSVYSSAVLSALHWKPENDDPAHKPAGPYVIGAHSEPPTTKVFPLGSTSAVAVASREVLSEPTSPKASLTAS
jgi:hypothetical protein